MKTLCGIEFKVMFNKRSQTEFITSALHIVASEVSDFGEIDLLSNLCNSLVFSEVFASHSACGDAGFSIKY